MQVAAIMQVFASWEFPGSTCEPHHYFFDWAAQPISALVVFMTTLYCVRWHNRVKSSPHLAERDVSISIMAFETIHFIAHLQASTLQWWYFPLQHFMIWPIIFHIFMPLPKQLISRHVHAALIVAFFVDVATFGRVPPILSVITEALSFLTGFVGVYICARNSPSLYTARIMDSIEDLGLFACCAVVLQGMEAYICKHLLGIWPLPYHIGVEILVFICIFIIQDFMNRAYHPTLWSSQDQQNEENAKAEEIKKE